MELPRPSLVNSVRLKAAAEGRRMIYLLQDTSSGRIFTARREMALALHRLLALRQGRAEARDLITEEDGRELNGFLGVMQHMREQETLGRKPFNPIFAGVPLLEVAPLQPALAGLARAVVRPAALVPVLLLALACLLLGLQSDWQILAAFRNVFSLEALVTFGLIAPVLKVVHEFGHVLVATRLGVPVRKAGLFFIALYPMPYVDMSEADVRVGRRGRIAITAAGIAVDVTVGMAAFVAWHFSAGTYMQTLLGNIFVFSTLNSLLFNGNPLIKLDGYFILSDAIGQRNLYARASGLLTETRRKVATLGRAGQWPRGGGQWAMLAYAVAALLYRINIMVVIAAALIPRHLGLGAVLAAWGAVVMFVSPLLRDRPPGAPADEGFASRRWLSRGLVAAGLAALALFVHAPFRVTVPLSLNVADHYLVTARSAGVLTAGPPTLLAAAPGTLLTLANPTLDEERSLMQADLQGARSVFEAVRSADPAQARVAAEQIANLEDRAAILDAQRDALSLRLTADAVFVPIEGAGRGRFLEPGQPVGIALPRAGDARLTGAFPERYVRLMQNGLRDAELRMAGAYSTVDPARIALVPIPSVDQSAGSRSYALHVTLPRPPAEVMGRPADIRLRFASAPLWRHAQFVAEGVVARYRDNLLIDRVDYLER
ncbi:hypothetical protein P6F26_17325 [Roseibacterium sp. SDUM158017]|uniref:hypothetical protein n=1 Tax=Roseicyclus salinarum TaxID=3036773 RepID=UPI002414F781|nr:hypothetical protein [Roseibacterium sp. SDUM158017]MDG4650212.1 hypothetical protein [Roseibacterium sp. SDUM158017]